MSATKGKEMRNHFLANPYWLPDTCLLGTEAGFLLPDYYSRNLYIFITLVYTLYC